MINSIYQWIIENKDWFFSGAGLAILGYLTTKFKSRNMKSHKLKLSNGKNSSKKVLNVDKSLLDELSNIFTGNTMYIFFYHLEDRIIYQDHIDKFDLEIDRFLSSDKVFRNKRLEKAKSAFLNSLKELIRFTSLTFYPINGNRYKFYGGISEGEILTTHVNSIEKDEKKYLKLARRVKKDWDKFQKVVRETSPDYDWNE